MPEVRWSRSAAAGLERISLAVREQLVSNAKEILHDITSGDFPRDQGFAGGTMWHRGIPCGMQVDDPLGEESDDGPWNYVLFYTRLPPDAEGADADQIFEVLNVCSVTEVAWQWKPEG